MLSHQGEPNKTRRERLAAWFDNNPALFLLLLSLLALLGLSLINLLTGCPQTRYKGYFLNITSYKLDDAKWKRTPKGIRVHAPEEIHAEIDRRTDELEACLLQRGLVKSIRREWFAVYIPSDWYTSRCGTKEQLVPSRIDYRLCEQKKDPQGNPIKIPVACRYVERPTKGCPCPCSVRATIQDSWVVVTAPNLKLYKTELSRIVLWPKANAPWADKEVAPCLRH